MLDNEEFIIGNIKENDPAKTEAKIIKWFVFNEMPTTLVHPSYFLSEEQQHNQKRDGIKMIRLIVCRISIKLLLLKRKKEKMILTMRKQKSIVWMKNASVVWT